MQHQRSVRSFLNVKTASILLITSFIVFIFWLLGHHVLSDVYKWPVVGALYELLAFPMVIGMFMIPVISLAGFILSSAYTRKLFLVSLLVSIATLLIIPFGR
jgi:hypothetical protein